MIDHIGLFVADAAKRADFYEKLLAPLGLCQEGRIPDCGMLRQRRGRRWHLAGIAEGRQSGRAVTRRVPRQDRRRHQGVP